METPGGGRPHERAGRKCGTTKDHEVLEERQREKTGGRTPPTPTAGSFLYTVRGYVNKTILIYFKGILTWKIILF